MVSLWMFSGCSLSRSGTDAVCEGAGDPDIFHEGPIRVLGWLGNFQVKITQEELHSYPSQKGLLNSQCCNQ